MSDNITYEHVKFEPWVGSLFGEAGLWNRRVLIVGESHYDTWQDENHTPDRHFTKECVQDLVDGNSGAVFWTHVANRIGGNGFQGRPRGDFWNRVAYYNYIQSALLGGAGKSKPAPWHLVGAKPCFEELITKLKPERVIVMSFLLRNNLSFVSARFVCEDLQVAHLNSSRNCPLLLAPHPRSGRLTVAMTPHFKDFIIND